MRKPRPSPIVALADAYQDELELYAWALEESGHTAARIDCGTAADAAVAILRLSPDVVITRIRPGTFGIDLTRLLRGAGSDVPVIVITTNTERKVHDAARAAGANEVYLLPLQPDVLSAAVRRHIDVATTGNPRP